MAKMGRVLVIAGSDSSGGAFVPPFPHLSHQPLSPMLTSPSHNPFPLTPPPNPPPAPTTNPPHSGIEADQRVIAAHACYALTATTALTAQDTSGVHAIHHIPSPFVRQQIDLSLADIGADVIKTGMLASAATVLAVAAALAEHPEIPLVLDPVMVSTSGAALLPPEALRVLREELLGRATVVTPNLPEARLLLADAGEGPYATGSVDEMTEIAWAVRDLAGKGEAGPWVLLKGGHCPRRRDGREARGEGEREVVVDVLVGPGGGEWRFETPWCEGTSTHGTGCSLACE